MIEHDDLIERAVAEGYPELDEDRKQIREKHLFYVPNSLGMIGIFHVGIDAGLPLVSPLKEANLLAEDGHAYRHTLPLYQDHPASSAPSEAVGLCCSESPGCWVSELLGRLCCSLSGLLVGLCC